MTAKKPKKPTFLEVLMAATQTEEVEVPQLGMTVVVRALSAREVNAATTAAIKPTPKGGNADEIEIDNDKLSTMLLAKALYSKDGERLIPDGREEELFDGLHEIIAPLNAVMQRLNGMGQAD